jgi:hypothetical protein
MGVGEFWMLQPDYDACAHAIDNPLMAVVTPEPHTLATRRVVVLGEFVNCHAAREMICA